MPQESPYGAEFFGRRRASLERAVTATARRDHWTPSPESPSGTVYGEDAAERGETVAYAWAERKRRPVTAGEPAHV